MLLVGAAGAGKSTIAARHFPPEAVLSSDAYRLAITGAAADQTRNRAVFSALHRDLDRRLAAGRIVVVDATNLLAAGRREIRRIAAAHAAPITVVVLDLPAADVLRQNAARGGAAVPVSVVERQLATLASTVRRGALEIEGYDRVIRLRSTAELDALAVMIRPRR